MRPDRPDWLYGTGAGPTEKGLVWLVVAAALGVLAVAHHRDGPDWWWWQQLLVAGLVADVVGGVVANSLAPAKRLYHGPAPGRDRPLRERVLRSHLAFTALHMHPFLVAAALPGVDWRWALGWYVAALAGTVAVLAVPFALKRPVAMGLATLAVLVALAIGDPAGIGWLGPVLVLKLVVAHAVPEASAPAGGQPNSG